MKKDRVPELHFYEWRLSAWALSETRDRLDATGRGIYRELLDQCYSQGRFPDDPDWICRKCACTPEQLSSVWPILVRHFPKTKQSGYRYNLPGSMVRNEYFRYVDGQRKRRKQAIQKSREIINIDKLACGMSENVSEQAPSLPQPNGNGKDTATATATARQEEAPARQPLAPPSAKEFGALPDFDAEYRALYDAYPEPGFDREGRFEFQKALMGAVEPAAVAHSMRSSLDAEWAPFWAANPGAFRPCIERWIRERWYLKKPAAREPPRRESRISAIAEEAKRLGREKGLC